ncbi:MAG TPA: TlpA disulfide reductase family protein [Stellaceae bacterium]|nr:TlpA disulfide reductase family protein [Stellaceae bacterium]
MRRGRPPAPSLRRFAAILAVVTAGAIAALWSGYELGPVLFPSGSSSGSAGRPAESPFAVQVWGQPRPMPALAFTDGSGRPLTLGDFRGRVVLLNVWATWCVPCRKEMPALDRLEGRLGGKDFVVLPVSIDQQGVSAVERFYRQYGLKRLGAYIGSSARLSQSLALPGVPTSFLIDAEGREVARKIGPAEWDGTAMLSLIRRYLPPNRQQGADP